jgi:uncharacterized pyridoxal phosphate-containing UPF0001 family protein
MSDRFKVRLEQVQRQIEAAARRSGRRAEAITLVAVTKTHPAEMVTEAYAAGVRDFGENRVEGLRERQELGLSDVRWHMIGHIQSRKIKELIGLCDVVHSVDRLSVAVELDKRLNSPPYPPLRDGEGKRRTHPLAHAQEGEPSQAHVASPVPLGRGEPLDVLLQVNVSGEESKGGWRVTSPEALESFIAEVAQVAAMPQVRIRGLMTMAPFYENPEMTRPYFVRLRTVQEVLQKTFPSISSDWLSMGMTNDYEIAIEEGATHVRIGTALFGERL